jgi:hypothetical protein
MQRERQKLWSKWITRRRRLKKLKPHQYSHERRANGNANETWTLPLLYPAFDFAFQRLVIA